LPDLSGAAFVPIEVIQEPTPAAETTQAKQTLDLIKGDIKILLDAGKPKARLVHSHGGFKNDFHSPPGLVLLFGINSR
jgi:hypothetical protein